MNGCFDDLQCPSADVRTAFYQYVESLRLHRLQEQQMISTRINEFYIDSKFLTSNPQFTYTSLPYLKTKLLEENFIINDNNNSGILLTEQFTRYVSTSTEPSGNETIVKFVNEQSIQHIWDILLLHVIAPANAAEIFPQEYKLRICNVDLLMRSAHGEFMLSLLLLGITNILRQSRQSQSKRKESATSNSVIELRRGISIELCVASNRYGRRAADLIQHYLEMQCHIPVIRSTTLPTATNIDMDDSRVDNKENNLSEEQEREEWESSNVNNFEEWVDLIKSSIVDIYEQVCDELSAPGSLLGVNKKQLILLILPEVSWLRKVVIHALVDAYTSIPLQVREEQEINKSDVSLVHVELPLVFVCSAEWLCEQTLLIPETTIFSYIHVSAIVYGKFINNELSNSNFSCAGTNDIAELMGREANDVEAIVLMLCNQNEISHLSSVITCTETNNVTLPIALSEVCTLISNRTDVLQWRLLEVNILLSITRRFRLRTRRASKLLYMIMHRHNFASERAWRELLTTLISMHNAGVVLVDDSLMKTNMRESDVNEVEFTLTPFARLASATMKMHGNILVNSNLELSIIDKKYLMWMFLFRQSKEEAMEGVRSWHTFNDEVDKAISVFYEAVNVTFTSMENRTTHAFHNLCACFARVGFTDYTSGTTMTLLSSSSSSSSSSTFFTKEESTSEILFKYNEYKDNNINSFSNKWEENRPNRVYHLIVAPHGFRTRSVHDSSSNNGNAYLHSNICRGWEVPSSPLEQDGTPVSQPQIWSLPTASLYCELLPYVKSAQNVIQCPIIYSQPIIVLHSVLHISFHNACIFAEMQSDVMQVPLPELLLQSPVFSMLLQSSSLQSSEMEQSKKASRESWVDVYTSFVKAVPSASEMYSLLSLHNIRFVESCEHGSRKREREPSESELQEILSAQRDAAKSSGNTKTFKGVQPRTPLEEEAIAQFLKLVERVGREKAERAFRGKKGFAFIDPKHDLHPFYLYSLKRKEEDIQP